MSDEQRLTDLPRVGPDVADALREAGYRTKRDVLEEDPDVLKQVNGIGGVSARIIVGDKEETNGRKSKFEDAHEDILAAARGEDMESSAYLNMKQIAGAGGVSTKTLYRWLDEHDQFRQRFTHARNEAAGRLVQRALDPADEVDSHFVRFLLERCFQFIKTEKHEVELDADHTVDRAEGVSAEFVTYDNE